MASVRLSLLGRACYRAFTRTTPRLSTTITPQSRTSLFCVKRRPFHTARVTCQFSDNTKEEISQGGTPTTPDAEPNKTYEKRKRPTLSDVLVALEQWVNESKPSYIALRRLLLDLSSCDGPGADKVLTGWELFMNIKSGEKSPNTHQCNLFLDVFSAHPQSGLACGEKLLKFMDDNSIDCDVYTFTNMIKLCVGAGKFEKGLEMLRRMIGQRVTPNAVTFTVLLDAYARDMDEPGVRQILHIMKEQDIELDVYIYNIVLRVLLKKKKAEAANQLMSEMHTKGVQPNEFTLSILLMYMIDNPSSKPSEWLEMVDSFEKRDVPVTMPVCDVLMFGCGRRADIESARKVLELVQSRNLTPDLSFYNRLMHVFAEKNHMAHGWQLLDTIEGSGMVPDTEAFSLLIRSYGDSVTRENVEKVVDRMINSGMELRLADIVLLARKLPLPSSLYLVQTIRERTGMVASAHVYGDMVHMCANGNGDGTRLASVLMDMKAAGHDATFATYASLLRVLAVQGDVTAVQSLLANMEKHTIPITINTINQIITVSRTPHIAYAIYGYLCKHNPEPSLDTYQAMLQVCESHNHPGMVEFARLVRESGGKDHWTGSKVAPIQGGWGERLRNWYPKNRFM